MQSKVYLFSLLFSLACLMWQCGGDDNGNPTPDTLPTITSFTPTSGGVGATVTITGTNFSTTASSNVVKFNGATATVSSATATSITTTVPANASTGKITVEVAGKTATSANDFTFIRYTVVSTFVGGTGFTTLDGTGTAAGFAYPWGIIKDAQGNFYVSEYAEHVIRKITPQGVVTTLAGAKGQTGDADGTGTTVRFRIPTGLCIDASNNVYVGEAGGNRIRKITPAGVVSTFVGSTTAQQGSTDGTGTAARFWGVLGLTMDTQGNMYVADANNQKIRKVTPAGVVTTIASNIASMTGIFISPQGTLYVTTGSAVYTVNITTGATTLLAGNADTQNGQGFADGTGTTARFRGARLGGMDSMGNLYIADADNKRVRKIDSNGNVTTVAGNGTSASIDGPIATAGIGQVPSLFVDLPSNIIYTTDISGYKVRKIE